MVLIGIILAKSGYTLAQIGAYENLIFTSGMLTFFWVGAMIQSLLACYGKCDESQKRITIYNTFVVLAACSVVVAAALWIYAQLPLPFISARGLTQAGNRTVCMLAGAYILFNVPAYIIEYVLFLHGRSKELIGYALLSSTVTLALSLAMVKIDAYQPLMAMAAVLSAVAVIKFFYALTLLNRYGAFHFQKKLFWEQFLTAWPILLSLLVSGSAEYIDGWLVGEFFSSDVYAVYRYGAKELPVLLLIANTFSAAVITEISANTEKGLTKLYTGSQKLMHWMFPVTIALLLCSEWLYRVVFSDSFMAAHRVFDVYLLLIIPRLVFPQSILTASGNTRPILLSSLLEITLNVTVSYFLGKQFGYVGIAWGTVVAFCADKLFLTYMCYRRLGIPVTRYVPLRTFLLYSALLVTVYLWKVLV